MLYYLKIYCWYFLSFIKLEDSSSDSNEEMNRDYPHEVESEEKQSLLHPPPLHPRGESTLFHRGRGVIVQGSPWKSGIFPSIPWTQFRIPLKTRGS